MESGLDNLLYSRMPFVSNQKALGVPAVGLSGLEAWVSDRGALRAPSGGAK